MISMSTLKQKILYFYKRIYSLITFKKVIQQFYRNKCNKIYCEWKIPKIDNNEYVLVEALWENPNHWGRINLIGSALCKEHQLNMLGLVKDINDDKTKSLKAGGVHKIHCFIDEVNLSKKSLEITKELLKKINEPEDILNLKLPFDVPASRLYDTILKRQRAAVVDCKDPQFIHCVQKFIEIILKSDEVLRNFKVKVVVLSHSISHYWSALAWLAIQKQLPCYILDNFNGSLRINRLSSEEDYYSPNDSPDRKFIDLLSDPVKKKLTERGKEYLKKRHEGVSIDLSGRLAYNKEYPILSKKDLCEKLGWQKEKPIVGIMMSNWFDFPHTYGMNNFRDILDWIQVTKREILNLSNVQWLIKPHPAEHRWYGGLSLQKAIGSTFPAHIKYFPEDIHSLTMLSCAEGIITPYGTAGLEYSCYNKKVLLADKSFYSDWGFTSAPRSRQEYIDLLRKFPENFDNSYLNVDHAFLYVGMYLAVAESTPEKYFYPCDSAGYEVYKLLPDFFRNNIENIAMERTLIKRWIRTNFHSYHAYKCALASGWEE